MNEHNDLLSKNGNVLIAHDDDDAPPQVGYSDVHWWVMNRLAEFSMRWMRALGFLALLFLGNYGG